MPARGYLLAIIAATLWGISGVVAKSLFNAAIDPLKVVAIRLTLSAVVLLMTLTLVSRRRLRVTWRQFAPLAVLGTLGMATNQATYFYAISATSVAVAIFLQYLAPVIVALYAVLFQGQRLSRWTVAALGAALAGSALLLAGAKGGLGHAGTAGVMAGLASACCFAFYTIWSNRYVQKTDPWAVLLYALLCAALVWNVLRPPWVTFGAPYSSTTWLAFAFIAVFGTLLPFGAYLSSLRTISASHASITATLEPVVAGVVAFALLGETLLPLQVLGGAGIVAGVLMVQFDNRGQ